MWYTSDAVVLGITVCVQVIGVASVALARASERSVAQTLCQLVFFLSLLVVGGISLVAVSMGMGCRLVCATMLPLMAVGATLDLQRKPECSAF